MLWKNTTSYILTSKAKGLKAAELSRNWQKIIIAQSSEWKLQTDGPGGLTTLHLVDSIQNGKYCKVCCVAQTAAVLLP